MKSRIIILIGCCLLLTSCIVKSINPFYTKESVAFQAFLVGEWEDQKKHQWRIESLKQRFYEENTDMSKVTPEDKALFEKYKEGYFVTIIYKDNVESHFLAMPFTIDAQIFVDFIPFELENTSTDLLNQHLLKTHSVAKIDKDENQQINITWLDEEHVQQLFKEDRLKLKHEKVGWDESFVLTAPSEDLYKFLKKYNTIEKENKWETSEKFTLRKVHAKP